MHYSKPANTPIKKGITLNLDQCPKTNDKMKAMNNSIALVPWYNAPNAHVSLFVISLINPLIRIDKSDGRDVTAVQKDKTFKYTCKI